MTKLGEQSPLFGKAISEDTEMMKQRKKGGTIEWSTDYVYTMALWSGKRADISCVVMAVSLISNIHNLPG